jgi:uncharacterized membrane protein required for colicin V production
MSIYLVLDLLLILLIALFAPIGYWRGPVKELLVTFGVLFGILLADFWARPWGRDLAEISAIGANGGAFVVAMAFMVTVTFVLGYGAGATLAPARFGSIARTIGAAIALFNGTLLVAFSLQYVRVFLLAPSTEEALYDSYVVSFLLDQIGWVLLLVALISWPVLLAILVTGRRAYDQVEGYDDYAYGPVDDIEYEDEAYYAAAAGLAADYDRDPHSADTRVYPPRVPVSQQDDSAYQYKTEPASQNVRPTDATRPISTAQAWESPEASRVDTDDVSHDHGHTDPAMATIPASQDDDLQPDDVDQDQVDYIEADAELAPGYSRCLNCHAVLPPNAKVCPVCGEVN